MVKFLTQEWLDQQRELTGGLTERPGVSARLQFKVTGTPHGDVAFSTVVTDGRIVENRMGDDPKADVVLAIGYADFVRIGHAELDVSSAFMQGRLKPESVAPLLAIMPLVQSPEYRALAAQLDAQTDY